jgi:DnaJ family protein A protein 2
MINPKLRCKTCKGQKTVKERKILEVAIDKGARNKQKVKFQGEANASPGVLAGDVIFVIQVKDHDVFRRKGHHLYMNKKLSLKDALCGCSFTVTHMDDRVLHVTIPPGTCIAADSLKMIEGEGMPMHGNPFVKGNLIIQFDVEFPSTIDSATAKQLKTLLPGDSSSAFETEDMEPCTLREFNAAAAQQEYESNKSAYDSDDEDDERGGGGRGVQCAQG